MAIGDRGGWFGRDTGGRDVGGENRPEEVSGLIPSGGEEISTGPGVSATLAVGRGCWDGLGRF